MTSLLSLLAACQISATGWAVLAATTFLLLFGEKVSARIRARKEGHR